jgi:hypothetical protein
MRVNQVCPHWVGAVAVRPGAQLHRLRNGSRIVAQPILESAVAIFRLGRDFATRHAVKVCACGAAIAKKATVKWFATAQRFRRRKERVDYDCDLGDSHSERTNHKEETVGLVNLVLIVMGIVTAYYVFKMIARIERKKELRQAIASLPDFACTYHHVGDDGYDGIAIDETNGTLYFFRRELGRLASYRVGASDIVSSDVFEDTVTRTVQSGGRVVVMVGRIGVPLGGPRLTTHHRVARLELRAIVNDPAIPMHAVTFIGSECKRGGIAHAFFGELAKQWQARIHVLATRARVASTTHQQVTSVADELRTLAMLKAEGLLSEDEFDAQRERLFA